MHGTFPQYYSVTQAVPSPWTAFLTSHYLYLTLLAWAHLRIMEVKQPSTGWACHTLALPAPFPDLSSLCGLHPATSYRTAGMAFHGALQGLQVPGPSSVAEPCYATNQAHTDPQQSLCVLIPPDCALPTCSDLSCKKSVSLLGPEGPLEGICFSPHLFQYADGERGSQEGQRTVPGLSAQAVLPLKKTNLPSALS